MSYVLIQKLGFQRLKTPAKKSVDTFIWIVYCAHPPQHRFCVIPFPTPISDVSLTPPRTHSDTLLYRYRHKRCPQLLALTVVMLWRVHPLCIDERMHKPCPCVPSDQRLMPNLHSHFHPYPSFLSGFDLPLQKEGKAEFFPYEMDKPSRPCYVIVVVVVETSLLPVVFSFTTPASNVVISLAWVLIIILWLSANLEKCGWKIRLIKAVFDAWEYWWTSLTYV